ncbi:HAD family hydrolase [Streptomyces sp. A7024]|uniref:D,D-heptose 1,7-bisphosphate phosphatase n=1 Tax=Streptomyces coryli TaxID=1128680 RepID=A0A6G4UDI1_9ACTN|nr:HAD family hydrolase [Streptomyces coryli]NGN70285.1 HAD family hydrolase [Streptomyces coryli]
MTALVRPVAVLFDRDDTLIENIPYNGDPARVRPRPTARQAVALLRSAGVRIGCVTNQRAVGLGLISIADVRRVHARVDQLVGPLDVWAICPHLPADHCGCRKPAPGLILEVAARLHVNPRHCVVIGDIGSDMAAAAAAGAQAVLVPTPLTRAEEIRDAPRVAPDLLAAVKWSLA